jgi:hypothetical protein
MIVIIMQQMPTKPRETPTPIPIFAPLLSPGEGVIEAMVEDEEPEVPEAVFEATTEPVVGVLPPWVVDADAEPGAVEAALS